jgi:Fe-S-cluster containining protein
METPGPWYEEGLRFECTRCGHCCGGGPGMVRVTDEEIAVLAKRLRMTETEFRERHTRPFRANITILQEKPNFDCVFYDRERGCTVYEDRPKQCRAWPFWQLVVHSPRTWAEAATDCPGINRGPLHSAESIARVSADDGTCSSELLRELAQAGQAAQGAPRRAAR